MNLLLAVRWRPIRGCTCYLSLFEPLHIGIVVVAPYAKGFLGVPPSGLVLIKEFDRVLMKILGRVLFFDLEEWGLRAKLQFKSFQFLKLLEMGSQAKEINCWREILVFLESLGLNFRRTDNSLGLRCLIYDGLCPYPIRQLKSYGCWLVVHHDWRLIKYLARAAMVEAAWGRKVSRYLVPVHLRDPDGTIGDQ